MQDDTTLVMTRRTKESEITRKKERNKRSFSTTLNSEVLAFFVHIQ